MSEEEALIKLREDGRKIAKRFKLRYLEITKEAPKVRARFGSCDEDRVIRIRLHSTKSGKFLSYRTMIDTLCHEMAHLKHMNHGKDFKRLHSSIKNWAKNRGIIPT